MLINRATPLVLMLAATSAQASIVFNQTPTDQQASQNSQYTSGASMTRTADDFRLPTGTGGTYTVQWVFAQMMTSLGEDTTKYALEIYNDAGGAPGSIIYSKGSASQAQDMGLGLSGLRIVEARFFVSNWTFQPDTVYWLSVVGTAGGTGQARFATSNYGGTANGSVAMYKVGTGAWAPVNLVANSNMRDMAFRLDAVQAAPTPAPAAAALLALGGCLASRRRRGR